MTNHTYTPTPGTIYFIGAGPGAPDLITVRGQDIIAQADLILYADSLVEASVAALAKKPDAQIVASSGLHLERMVRLMVEASQANQVVARVHSGDPALYGAVHEQMAYLEDDALPYEIIPGVTSTFAAAAKLKSELTVPDIVQTIILTRTAGRTTMPEGEDLRKLAATGSSLSIHLSVGRIHRVVEDLLAGGAFTPDTPVAVLHKVTWPDESMVVGTLADIVEKTREAGYTKHALILVSPALDPALKGADRRTSSHLYDKTYTHLFRKSEEPRQRAKGRRTKDETTTEIAAPEGMAIISLTRTGTMLGSQLANTLNVPLFVPEKFTSLPTQEAIEVSGYTDSSLAAVRRAWQRYQRLVLVMPTGVAVRAIAPLLHNKVTDPAIICLDEAGQSVIPLLGGHRAGANELARHIAEITGGIAAITTASDVQDKPAIDLLGQEDGWHIDPKSALTHASACLVNDELLGVYLDDALSWLQPQVTQWLESTENMTLVESLDALDVDAYAAGLIISHQTLSDRHTHLLEKCVLYRPPVLVVGMGCRKGVPMEELQAALKTTFAEEGLSQQSIMAIATVDFKGNEPDLQALSSTLDVPLQTVSQEKLAELDPNNFSPSAAQDKFGLPGVAEPCAAVIGGGDIIVAKQSFDRCTVAVALNVK